MYRGSNEKVVVQVTDLVRQGLRTYREAEMIGDSVDGGGLGCLRVTVKRIMTCIFLGVCIIALGKSDRSFAILREGITMLQASNVLKYHASQSEESQSTIATWQRLYWLAFIHERSLSVMLSFPSVLTALQTGLPIVDPSIPPHIDLGFRRLAQLFLVLDNTFLAHWNAQQDPGHSPPAITAEWIEYKQVLLDEYEVGTKDEERSLKARGLGGLTEIQHCDLLVSRIWLRTLLWQLALSMGLLYSSPSLDSHGSLFVQFPVQRLSGELRTLVETLESVTSVAIHGFGMLHKLFEVTTTIADVLALPMGSRYNREMASGLKDFSTIVKFLLGFEGIQQKWRDYLCEKVKVLPNVHTDILEAWDLIQADFPHGGAQH